MPSWRGVKEFKYLFIAAITLHIWQSRFKWYFVNPSVNVVMLCVIKCNPVNNYDILQTTAVLIILRKEMVWVKNQLSEWTELITWLQLWQLNSSWWSWPKDRSEAACYCCLMKFFVGLLHLLQMEKNEKKIQVAILNTKCVDPLEDNHRHKFVPLFSDHYIIQHINAILGFQCVICVTWYVM